MDRTGVFHLVLREKGTTNTQQRVVDTECNVQIDAGEPSYTASAPASQLSSSSSSSPSFSSASASVSPLELVHAIVAISVDANGSRSMTMLRSASWKEVQRWWTKWRHQQHQQHGSGHKMTDEEMDELQMRHRELYETDLRTIPLKLQQGALPRLAALEPSSRNRFPTLRVMSANIWNYNYWHRRLHLISTLFNETQPDTVGFQEVRAIKSGPNPDHPAAAHEMGEGMNEDDEHSNDDIHSGRWQISDLVSALPFNSRHEWGWEWIYAPAMGFLEGRTQYVHEGLAIASRRPIIDVKLLKLSRNTQDAQDFHQRMCMKARIRVGAATTRSDDHHETAGSNDATSSIASATSTGGFIDLLNTHLSLSHDARSRTLKEIAEFAMGPGWNHASKRPHSPGQRPLSVEEWNVDLGAPTPSPPPRADTSSTGTGDDGPSDLPAPSILVGDFNSVFNEGPHLLTDDKDGAAAESSSTDNNADSSSSSSFRSISPNFVDTWTALNGAPSTPEEEARGWTFNTWNPKSRIDFIFYRNVSTTATTSSSDSSSSSSASPSSTASTFSSPAQPPLPLSLHPRSMHILGKDAGESLDEPLPPIGGVEDMQGMMYPSDHYFLQAEFDVIAPVAMRPPKPSPPTATDAAVSHQQPVSDEQENDGGGTTSLGSDNCNPIESTWPWVDP